MLIGVISDTHDNLPMTARAVRELASRGVAMLIHAGDYVAPFTLRVVLRAGLPVVGVFGNNDGERAGLNKLCGNIFQGPHRFEAAGRRIVVAHSPEELAEAIEPGDELAVCGHTHEPDIEAGPPLTVNPGEAGGWLTGHATAAIVDLKAMNAEIIELGRQETERP